MNLHQFISSHIPGLRLLTVSLENYIPGAILDHKKMRLVGHCRDLLPDEPGDAWTYTKSKASMVYGTISYDRKVQGNIRLLGIVSVSGGYTQDLKVHMSISDIRGASLDMSQIVLHPKLNALRRTDRRGRWRQINNQFVVTEAFYAREVEVSFYRQSELMGKAELENVCRVRVNARIDAHWETDRSLVIANHDKVPFGVRGFCV